VRLPGCSTGSWQLRHKEGSARLNRLHLPDNRRMEPGYEPTKAY